MRSFVMFWYFVRLSTGHARNLVSVNFKLPDDRFVQPATTLLTDESDFSGLPNS